MARVLNRISKIALKIELKKVTPGLSELWTLGHVASSTGMSVDNDKFTSIIYALVQAPKARLGTIRALHYTTESLSKVLLYLLHHRKFLLLSLTNSTVQSK